MRTAIALAALLVTVGLVGCGPDPGQPFASDSGGRVWCAGDGSRPVPDTVAVCTLDVRVGSVVMATSGEVTCEIPGPTSPSPCASPADTVDHGWICRFRDEDYTWPCDAIARECRSVLGAHDGSCVFDLDGGIVENVRPT